MRSERGTGSVPPSVVLLRMPELPGQRNLAQALQRLLPAATWLTPPSTSEPELGRFLKRHDQEGRASVVALGPTLAESAVASCPHLRLVLAGDVEEIEGRLRETAAASEGRIRVLRHAPPVTGLASLRERLLPEVRRIAVLGPPSLAATWSRLAPEVIALDPGAPGGVERRLAEIRLHADALLVLERPELLHETDRILARAAELDLPVLTTSPWIARIGATAAVVPEVEMLALEIALALRGRLPEHRRLPETLVRILNLEAFERLGLEVPSAAAAACDVLLPAHPDSRR